MAAECVCVERYTDCTHDSKTNTCYFLFNFVILSEQCIFEMGKTKKHIGVNAMSDSVPVSNNVTGSSQQFNIHRSCLMLLLPI